MEIRRFSADESSENGASCKPDAGNEAADSYFADVIGEIVPNDSLSAWPISVPSLPYWSCVR